MTAERRRHPRMLLMAAGVGITPMRALLEDTPYEPGEATLIYRYRATSTRSSATSSRRSPSGAASSCTCCPARGPRDDSWLRARRRRRRARCALVPDVADRDVYLCGPVPWIAAVTRALKAAGVRAARSTPKTSPGNPDDKGRTRCEESPPGSPPRSP